MDLQGAVYLVASGLRGRFSLIALGPAGARTIARGFHTRAELWDAVERVSAIKRPCWPSVVAKVG
jgi:hypothetical protein